MCILLARSINGRTPHAGAVNEVDEPPKVSNPPVASVASWDDLVSNVGKGNSVELSGNMVADQRSGKLNVQSGKSITLDLNGFELDLNGTSIVNMGSMTVMDGSVVNGQSVNGGAVYNGYNAELLLDGVDITSSSASKYGGGVNNAGTMELRDVSITGNSAQWGGGVFNTGSLTLSGEVHVEQNVNMSNGNDNLMLGEGYALNMGGDSNGSVGVSIGVDQSKMGVLVEGYDGINFMHADMDGLFVVKKNGDLVMSNTNDGEKPAIQYAGQAAITSATVQNSNGTGNVYDLLNSNEFTFDMQNPQKLHLTVQKMVGEEAKVEIALSDRMKLVSYTQKGDVVSSVQHIPGNTYGLYSCKNSGKLVYTLDRNASTVSLTVIVEYDDTFFLNAKYQQRMNNALQVYINDSISLSVNANIIYSIDNYRECIRDYPLSSVRPLGEFTFYNPIVAEVLGTVERLEIVLPIPQNRVTGEYAQLKNVKLNYVNYKWENHYVKDNALHVIIENTLFTHKKYGIQVSATFEWKNEQQLVNDGKKQVILNFDPYYTYKLYDVDYGKPVENRISNEIVNEFSFKKPVNFSVQPVNFEIANFHKDHPEIAYNGALFLMENIGYEDTGKVTISYHYNYGDKIGVVGQRVTLESNGNSEVYARYKTNLNQSWRGFDLAQKGKDFSYVGDIYSLNRDDVGLGENEYFTDIEFDVGNYMENFISYGKSNALSYPPFTLIKLLTNDSDVDYADFCTVTVKSADDNGQRINVKSSSYLIVQSTPKPIQMSINGINIYKDKIYADNLVNNSNRLPMHFMVEACNYQYENTIFEEKPTIYVRIPKEANIENLDVTKIYYGYPSKLKNKKIESHLTFSHVDNQGWNVYKITFDDGEAKMGQVEENFTTCKLLVKMNLVFDEYASSGSYSINDMLFIHGNEKYGDMKPIGGYIYELTKDIYDVDNDGKTDDWIGNINKFYSYKFSVFAAKSGIMFNHYMKLDNGNFTNWQIDGQPTNQNEVVVAQNGNHNLVHRLHVKNNSGKNLQYVANNLDDSWMVVDVPKKANGYPVDVNLTNISIKPVKNDASYLNVVCVLQNGSEVAYNQAVQNGLLGNVKSIKVSIKPGITVAVDSEADIDISMSMNLDGSNIPNAGTSLEVTPKGSLSYTIDGKPNISMENLETTKILFNTGILSGKVFEDRNFNQTMDAGEGKNDVDIIINGPGVSNKKVVPVNGIWKMNGLQAGSHTVKITNPQSGADKPASSSSLKMIPNSKFVLQNGQTAVANVQTSNGAVNDLDIIFQKAHNITLELRYPQNEGVPNQTWNLYAWNGTNLVESGQALPNLSLKDDFVLQHGENPDQIWTNDGANFITNDQIKNLKFNSSQTWYALATRASHTLNYHDGLDNYKAKNMPSSISFTLNDGKIELSKTVPTVDGDVAFIGWSAAPANDPINIYDDIDKYGLIESVSAQEHDIDVYGIWGDDKDGNGVADIVERFHVAIHGGEVDEANIQNMPATNPQYVTPGTEVFIDYGITTDLDNVAFIGLSKDNVNILDIYDEIPKLEESTITVNGDVDLYAVWGEDKDGDGVADITERFAVNYNANLLDGMLPDNLNGMPVNNPKYGIRDDVIDLDERLTVGDNVAFIGWSFGRVDHVIKKMEEAPKLEASITIIDSDVEVYAVWGEDINNDGVADSVEQKWSVTYDGNAQFDGAAVDNVPCEVFLVNDEIVDLTAVPKHPDLENGASLIFLGWSDQKLDMVEHGGDLEIANNAIVKELRMGTEPIKLYAVWAVDFDHDGVVDVSQLHVKYDLGADDAALPNDVDKDYYKDDYVNNGDAIIVKKEPSRGGYHFTGWKIDGSETILKPNDEFVVEGNLKLVAQWSPIRHSSDNNWDLSDEIISAGGRVDGDYAYINGMRIHMSHVKIHAPYVAGYVNGKFGPEDDVTRAQAVTMVNRALKQDYHHIDGLHHPKEFIDVLEDDWYYKDVCEASTMHLYRDDAIYVDGKLHILSKKEMDSGDVGHVWIGQPK